MDTPQTRLQIPHFEDIMLTCVECGAKFVWEAGEHAFYYSKGLQNPKRCPRCRALRKQTVNPPINPEETLRRAHRLFPSDYDQGVRK
jgi:NAD-dependent SIR2 family protein deacetylase